MGVAKKYFIGTQENSPLQNITVGGICFHRYTESVSVEESGETLRNRQLGQIITLKDKQVEKIKKSAAEKFIRSNRIGRNPKIVSKDGRYEADDFDQPVGKFVYMVDIEEAAKAQGAMWMNAKHPSLIQTVTIETKEPEKSKESTKKTKDK